eukprot:5738365-Prymnesium_polylepis.1
MRSVLLSLCHPPASAARAPCPPSQSTLVRTRADTCRAKPLRCPHGVLARPTPAQRTGGATL